MEVGDEVDVEVSVSQGLESSGDMQQTIGDMALGLKGEARAGADLSEGNWHRVECEIREADEVAPSEKKNQNAKCRTSGKLDILSQARAGKRSTQK